MTLLLFFYCCFLLCVNGKSDDNVVIKCKNGWGNEGDEVIIPIEKINDGYCDCPFDGGIDEPLTEACSGSIDWPGNNNKKTTDEPKQYFQCPQQVNLKLPLSRINDGICDCCDGVDESSTQCIDVCDEMLAEERKAKALIKEKYEKGSKILIENINKFKEKLETNNISIIDINEKQIPEQENKLNVVEKRIIKKQNQYGLNRILKLKQITDNSDSSDSSIVSPLTNTELITLIVYTCQLSGEMDSNNKNNRGSNKNTCIPLRLAGLDMAILWKETKNNENDTMKVRRCIREKVKDISSDNNAENENDSNIELITDSNDDDNDEYCNFKDVVDLMEKQSRNEYISWSSSSTDDKKDKKKHDRRHRSRHHDHDDEDYDRDEHDDDDMYDDYHGDDDMYMDGDDEYDHDEYDHHDHHDHDPRDKNEGDDKSSNSSDNEDEESLLTKLKKMPLSSITIRNQFIQYGNKIIQKIDTTLDNMNKANEDEEDDNDIEQDNDNDENKEETEEQETERQTKEEQEDTSSSNDDNSNIDPVTYRMVRNTIKKYIDTIERGYKHGESGLILMNSLFLQPKQQEQESNEPFLSNDELKQLAMGTLYHSNISSKDLYQLLILILPEFGISSSKGEEESCLAADSDDESSCIDATTTKTPLELFCPVVQPIQRNGSGMSYPPESILKAGKEFCESSKDVQTSTDCFSNTETDTDDIEIPSANDISSSKNGFCGYTTIHPRGVDDDNDDDPLSLVFKELQETAPSLELVDLEKKQDEINKKLKDFKDNVKNLQEEINIDKYGTNGELFSMKDECYSVTAGKYVYEVCIFGSAKQKEGDKGSGTSLGSWSGLERDEDSGEITMKWDKGQKCWNGPQRSATVHVKCGSDHKILSAEEPDTCRYVLEMESPLGCDEHYKQRFGL